jgi:membrane protein YqaA with SNARE-associated domain
MLETISQWMSQVWSHPLWSDPNFFVWALLVLFIWAFLAATVLSLPSEAAFLLLLVRYPEHAFGLWALASVGNFLGGCTTFWFGHWLREKKEITIHSQAKRWLERWGGFALLGSSVPVVGDAMVLAAGYLRLSLLPCMGALFLGKAVRYAVLAGFTA